MIGSDPSYRGEACQHLDLDLVGLEVKGHFRIRKVQPEVWYMNVLVQISALLLKLSTSLPPTASAS